MGNVEEGWSLKALKNSQGRSHQGVTLDWRSEVDMGAYHADTWGMTIPGRVNSKSPEARSWLAPWGTARSVCWRRGREGERSSSWGQRFNVVQSMKGLAGHYNDLGFYTEWNGELMGQLLAEERHGPTSVFTSSTWLQFREQTVDGRRAWVEEVKRHLQWSKQEVMEQ